MYQLIISTREGYKRRNNKRSNALEKLQMTSLESYFKTDLRKCE